MRSRRLMKTGRSVRSHPRRSCFHRSLSSRHRAIFSSSEARFVATKWQHSRENQPDSDRYGVIIMCHQSGLSLSRQGGETAQFALRRQGRQFESAWGHTDKRRAERKKCRAGIPSRASLPGVVWFRPRRSFFVSSRDSSQNLVDCQAHDHQQHCDNEQSLGYTRRGRQGEQGDHDD